MQNESKVPKKSFRLEGRVVFFATNNIHKFNEARIVFSRYGVAVGMLRAKALEIQNDNVGEIAKSSAIDAFERCHLPVIVEDAGLFVDALKGFPGPYSAYVYKTLGNGGLLKLMDKVMNRRAKFQSVIAYCDNLNIDPMCFAGESLGNISTEEHKDNKISNFGFDPIFLPKGNTRTFAEMNLEEKNGLSHRAEALAKFSDWCKTQQ